MTDNWLVRDVKRLKTQECQGTPHTLPQLSSQIAVEIENRLRDFLAQKFTAAFMSGDSLEEVWGRITGEKP